VAKIYLVRHGQASFSADNYDKLSDVGETQAGLLSQCLEKKHLSPDVIVTGSMFRHKQTADLSLSHLNREQCLNIEDDRWNEYDHQNILSVYKPEFETAKSMRSYLSKQPEPMVAFRKHFIAAINQWMSTEQDDENHSSDRKYTESWLSFTKRTVAALNDLVEQHKGKTIVVYTSGGPISLITCHLLSLPLTQSIHINWSLVNAGITKVIARGANNDLMLSTLNEHDVFEQQNDKKLITYT